MNRKSRSEIYLPVRQQCPKNFHNKQGFCENDPYKRGICRKVGSLARNANFAERREILVSLCEKQILYFDGGGELW